MNQVHFNLHDQQSEIVSVNICVNIPTKSLRPLLYFTKSKAYGEQSDPSLPSGGL